MAKCKALTESALKGLTRPCYVECAAVSCIMLYCSSISTTSESLYTRDSTTFVALGKLLPATVSLTSVSFQQESNNFLVSCTYGDMQRSPSIARRQPNISSVADEQFDKFEVACSTALVKGCLTVCRKDVDVDRLQGKAAGSAPWSWSR